MIPLCCRLPFPHCQRSFIEEACASILSSIHRATRLEKRRMADGGLLSQAGALRGTGSSPVEGEVSPPAHALEVRAGILILLRLAEDEEVLMHDEEEVLVAG